MTQDVCLNKGAIKLYTSYIPKFLHKENFLNNTNAEIKNIYIKTPVSLNLEIGGSKYILKEGEHFIPNIHTFHNFKFLSDVNNIQDIEIYNNCVYDDEYFELIKVLAYYTTILTSIVHKELNYPAMIGYGMCTGTRDINNIKRNIPDLDLDKLSLKFDFNWLGTKKVVNREFVKVNTYSQFIYGMDVKKVQKDSNVTDLLVNYDKDFTRDSMPPCIAICYEEQNFDKLQKILNTKYNIKLYKPDKPDTVFETKTYEEIVNDITNHNSKIKEFEEKGLIEFIITNVIPFTLDRYNKYIKKN